MHLGTSWGTARAGRAPELLEGVAGGTVWFSAAITEAGTNFFHPRSVVCVEADGRRVLRGRKVLSTGSPAATHLAAHAAVRGGEDDGRIASFLLPATLPGVRRLDDWDGLGMRASASSTVVFDDVELGDDVQVAAGGRVGEYTPAALCGRAFGNVTNLAAMHGIAVGAVEAARTACDGRATSRQALGEAVAQVSVSAAVLRDLGRRADEVAVGDALDLAGAHAFMATFQAAKLAVHRATVAAVDQAMQVAGGRSYSMGHPLARAYRDVRAGPFMEPFRPHEALGYLGALGAGVDPDVTA
jgi:alkylation response protein AidB-like acyl-CoA dehydrogenase